jgi:hypothetical protein
MRIVCGTRQCAPGDSGHRCRRPCPAGRYSVAEIGRGVFHPQRMDDQRPILIRQTQPLSVHSDPDAAGRHDQIRPSPFHFWLPNAMSAPTPISAFLHAATMVKAGIYLLMRLHPLLGGTPLWMGSLVLIGGTTALWGAIQALTPNDLKRVLGLYHHHGLGHFNDVSRWKQHGVTHRRSHLFAGSRALQGSPVSRRGKHRSRNRHRDSRPCLGGLAKVMPVTALAVAAATMSMAGFPLFFGFIGKEIMYEGALPRRCTHFSPRRLPCWPMP